VLPDAIPAETTNADFLAKGFFRPEKEGMPCPGERSEVGGRTFYRPDTRVL